MLCGMCLGSPDLDADELFSDEAGPWVDAGISKDSYDELMTEFVFLDANGDHLLSRAEFNDVSRLPEFLGMTAPDVRHLFDTVDVDHSGNVSLKEFINYMAKRKDHLPLPAQVAPQKGRLGQSMDRFGFRLCTTDGGTKGVSGDGNCQFYSLSWDLYQTTSRHAELRANIVDFLRGPGFADYGAFYAPTHPSQPGTFDGYLDQMSTDRTWGDQLTLQVAANLFNVEVHLLTADRFGDSSFPVLVLSPQQGGNAAPRHVWMSFAAQHYSPIEPTARTPPQLLSAR